MSITSIRDAIVNLKVAFEEAGIEPPKEIVFEGWRSVHAVESLIVDTNYLVRDASYVGATKIYGIELTAR